MSRGCSPPRASVVVVAMGRGGPVEPETVSVPPTLDALVALSRAGRHAASDHLETAALAGVETVGCRRCGGGLAGAVFVSNVLEGARVAAALGPDLVVFDGSGAALPPIAADRTIAVVGGHQSPAVAAGYLNAFRLLLADLVVLTMAEEGSEWRADLRRGSRGRLVRGRRRPDDPPAATDDERSRTESCVLLHRAARSARGDRGASRDRVRRRCRPCLGQSRGSRRASEASSRRSQLTCSWSS